MEIISRISWLIHFLSDAVFPRRCLGCDKEGVWVCSKCLETIRIYTQGEHTPFLFSAYPYAHPLVKRMVHALKYEYIAELGYSMGAMLAQAYSAREHTIMHPACIVPVPIHVKRLRDRGFNQSELIARAYAEAVDMPLIVDALTRGKNTQSQVHLSRVERMENMSGAFMARNTEKIRGRTVYLIDDVYTTGATLYEAARILQDAGARNVIGVTFAREE